jgi:tellurite resistance protein
MNANTPTHRSNTQTTWVHHAMARLAHMGPAWFVLVMGWSGLAQAWLRATDVLGDMALGLSLVAGGFALLIFSVLCLACIVRLNVHNAAVQADLKHPVRHAFMATLPISLMLLTTLGAALFWNTAPWLDHLLRATWLIGSLLELAATVWVLGRWLRPKEEGGLQWATFTPVLFIPVVGNVLAPLGGVTMGFAPWATAQMGIGLLLWPVLQTLLIVRLVQAGPMPARMSPALFITVVPPSIIGLDMLQLNAPMPFVWALWGVGVFFLMWALTQLDAMRSQAFGMGHWGMSFPLAAFTTLTLRLSSAPEGAWLQLPATALLAITSLVILGLTLGTWRGLRTGTLLVAEG